VEVSAEVIRQRIAVLRQEAERLANQWHAVQGKIAEDEAWIEWMEKQPEPEDKPDISPDRYGGIK